MISLENPGSSRFGQKSTKLSIVKTMLNYDYKQNPNISETLSVREKFFNTNFFIFDLWVLKRVLMQIILFLFSGQREKIGRIVHYI